MDRLLALDFDGTVVDTMEALGTIAVGLLERHGYNRVTARRRYFQTSGLPFREQLAELLAFLSDEDLDQLAEEFLHRSFEVYHYANLVPGVLELIENALEQPNLEVAVVSSTPSYLLAEHCVRLLPLDVRSRVLTYGTDRRWSTKALQVAHAAAVCGGEAVLIGDSPRDRMIAEKVNIEHVALARDWPVSEYGHDALAFTSFYEIMRSAWYSSFVLNENQGARLLAQVHDL